jgi:phosphoglycolate phosphatase-like HAD superfamily hydrolase
MLAGVSIGARRGLLNTPRRFRRCFSLNTCSSSRLFVRRSEMKSNRLSAYGLNRRVLLSTLAALPTLVGVLRSTSTLAQSDPLPSWNDGPVKNSIKQFVTHVTTQGDPDFVPEHQRIATFDNDGTLWVEQPMYVQLAFILSRVKTLAPQNPGWKTKQPFKAVLDGDMKALAASGEKGLMQLMAATHADMTSDEFTKIVSDWLATARHPRFKRPYTELVYQPMLEVLAYMRANGFKTFIVSGGGVEFMRPWTEKIYGIPPEQVVGSSIKTRFQMRGDVPTLFRLPEINFIDDKAGKPVGINQYIGRRPIAAFGNSDGDLEMLQWTTLSGDRARFGLIVHHTDAEREYAYDRQSHFGRLDKALDAAAVNKWTVADMKRDWKRIFPFEPAS